MTKTVIKLLSVVLVLGSIGLISSASRLFVSKADGDDTLKEIAGYKTWSRISKTAVPVVMFTGSIVDVSAGDLGG